MDADLGEAEESKPAQGAPLWMATMADMMSLLLTFFVLLLSFANMDVIKFRVMLGSVKDAFGVQTVHPGEIQALSTTPVELSMRESTPYFEPLETPEASAEKDAEMIREIEAAVAQLNLEHFVDVIPGDRGIVVRVKGQLLFDSGSAELRPAALLFLDEIALVARSFEYPVAIEGHTDDLPIHTQLFPDNWYLSSHRSIAALRYIAATVDPTRLSAAGYAHMRPIVPNDSPENRAMNRRVEFIYLRDRAKDRQAR